MLANSQGIVLQDPYQLSSFSAKSSMLYVMFRPNCRLSHVHMIPKTVSCLVLCIMDSMISIDGNDVAMQP